MKPYGTGENADTYQADRGNDAWAALDANKRKQALVRASDYVRNTYVRPLGIQRPEQDPLVEEATYIAAGIEAETPGFFAATYEAGEAKVLTEVKGIKWEVVGSGSSSLRPVATAIEAIFDGYPRRIGVYVV